MPKMLCRRFQAMLMCLSGLLLLTLITACTAAGTTTGQSSGAGTPATAQAQGSPTATQAAVIATPTQPPVATQPAVAFKAGGISFIGPVKSVNSSSLVMTTPTGQTFTLKISPQTDLSGFGGVLPTVGTSVDMDSAANSDGSFTATILKPARPGDPDVNVIAYTGMTTNAVGADRVIHLTVGLKSYTFTIGPSAVLSDFGGNAQAIGNNVAVKVKVQHSGSTDTVVSVGNPNA